MQQINSVPESITQTQVRALLRHLNIDPDDCISVAMDRNAVSVVVLARDETGRPFTANGIIATNVIRIRIVGDMLPDDADKCDARDSRSLFTHRCKLTDQHDSSHECGCGAVWSPQVVSQS